MKLFTKLLLSLIVGLSYTQLAFSFLDRAEPSDWWAESEPRDVKPGDPRLTNEDWMKYVDPKVFNSGANTTKTAPRV
ncbi:hypothetical protein H0X48_00015 [Candidatus Dependentiae bacterium]|nr:hypothetical protein [Candidatus Dependentiae bacterium]